MTNTSEAPTVKPNALLHALRLSIANGVARGFFIGVVILVAVLGYLYLTEKTESDAHRERMIYLILNEEYGILPTVQTDIEVDPGTVNTDVLFERDGKLGICNITTGEALGETEAKCVFGFEQVPAN